MATHPILILGTGMAALGAASRLADSVGRRSSTTLNHTRAATRRPSMLVRGSCSTTDPHVSFTKHDRIRDLLAANVEGNFKDIAPASTTTGTARGSRIPSRCTCTACRPTSLSTIIRDFVAVHSGDRPKRGRLRVLAPCGLRGHVRRDLSAGLRAQVPHHHDGPADHGLARTTDVSAEPWMRSCVARWHRPTRTVHYVTSFRYPTTGGFQSYLRPFLERFDIRLGCRVTSIDPNARTVGFADGTIAAYDGLVSSIPLPDLVPMIAGAPPTSSRPPSAFRSLGGHGEPGSGPAGCLGGARLVCLRRRHHLSAPELPSSAVTEQRPAGHRSIQVEVYFSDRYRPLTVQPETLIDKVISGPAAHRHPARGRPTPRQGGPAGALRERHLRP